MEEAYFYPLRSLHPGYEPDSVIGDTESLTLKIRETNPDNPSYVTWTHNRWTTPYTRVRIVSSILLDVRGWVPSIYKMYVKDLVSDLVIKLRQAGLIR